MTTRYTRNTVPASDDDLRSQAISRLNQRRGVLVSASMWAVVSIVLVVVWSRSGGFFWPVFPILFWGMAVLWQALAAFGPAASEDRIQREMHRLRGDR